jgi:serine/threonine-protein kinase
LTLDRLRAALADRYRLEHELGQGGMATVYLAADLKHDRKVALKVLKPELAAVLGAERFVVEIKTTAALQHPHILPLFDSGTAEGFLYYVMPYIQGETLRTKLDRETQLGIDEAVRITSDVAEKDGALTRVADLSDACSLASIMVGALGHSAVCLAEDLRSDIWLIDSKRETK